METVKTEVKKKNVLFVNDDSFDLAGFGTYILWIESMKNVAESMMSRNSGQEAPQIEIMVADNIIEMESIFTLSNKEIHTIIFVSSSGEEAAHTLKGLYRDKRVFVATAKDLEADMLVENGVIYVSKSLLENPDEAAKIFFS